MSTLELIVTISIIVIMSSICFMKYEGDNYKIEFFAKELCSDIRYVRRENMLNNPNVYIRFIVKIINGHIFYIEIKKKIKECICLRM